MDNTKNSSSLKQAIRETIAFFDLFDYPMTPFEIWKWLWFPGQEKATSIQDIFFMLSGGALARSVEERNGYYFLAGRQNTIEIRNRRYNITDRKFKRAILASRIFKIIPWVKMIAVGNMIGAHNLKEEGDIDLFIIAEEGRVWITRFFCIAIIIFLGLRPQPGDIRDKICLSFFITENNMLMNELMIKDSDSYFVFWLACLIPIYNKESTFERFMAANGWVNEFLPNWEPAPLAPRRDAGRAYSRFYRDMVNVLFGGLEDFFKRFELSRLAPDLKKILNNDKRVIMNDRMLKMHANDRREEYRRKWEERISKL
jgi:hypothetical protein